MLSGTLLFLPESLWGVFVGALLTLLGVSLQLKADARNRERDRQMQLRRDVFLEALDGVAGTQQYFFRFANLGVPFDQLASSAATTGWLNKLHAVGSINTISAFARADAALGKAAFDLLARRIGIQESADAIEAASADRDHLHRLQADIPALLQELVRLNLDDPAALHALASKALDETDTQLSTVSERLDTLHVYRIQQTRDLVQKSMEYFIGYQRSLRAALVAMRQELDLPIDAGAFEVLGEEVSADMQAAFERLLDRIDNSHSAAAKS